MAVETQSKSHYSFHYLSIASLCLEDAHKEPLKQLLTSTKHQSKFKMSTSGFQLLKIQVSDSPLLPPSFPFSFYFVFSSLSCLYFSQHLYAFLPFECFSFFRMLLFLAQTCVLKVHVNCNGCKQKVKKLLSRIEGPDFDNTLIISFFKLIYLQAILFLQAFCLEVLLTLPLFRVLHNFFLRAICLIPQLFGLNLGFLPFFGFLVQEFTR